MRILFFLFIALLISAHSQTAKADAQCQKLPAEIEQDIKAKASRIRGAEECQYRQIVMGHLANDDDYLVVYDVQDPCYEKKMRAPCGNFDVQYWVVYSRTADGYKPIAVDATPGNRMGLVKIEGGLIVAHIYTYAPMDGNCCPSVEKVERFKLLNGHIKKAK